MKTRRALFLALLLMAAPAVAQVQSYTNADGGIFYYRANGGSIVLIAYEGGGAVTIPTSFDGLPVTSIFDDAFFGLPNLNSVTIPGSITSIGAGAFEQCNGLTNLTLDNGITNIGEGAFQLSSLTSVYFGGSPPAVGADEFYGDTNETVYYLPGAIGWSSTFAGLPALLWNPLIQTSGASFAVQNNQFGFNITGTANIPIVVEACTNLANPVWTPLTNVTLTNGLFYFSDSQWTNYPGRYYEISAP